MVCGFSNSGTGSGAGCPRVIGVTTAVIGCIQATEVIKYIVGIGELLTNRLLTFNGLGMKFTEFKVKKDPGCEHCGHLAGVKNEHKGTH